MKRLIRWENKTKKDMLEHTIDADKTYLINFLFDLEKGVQKTDVQKKEHKRYTKDTQKNGGNSYVHDKWEEVKKFIVEWRKQT